MIISEKISLTMRYDHTIYTLLLLVIFSIILSLSQSLFPSRRGITSSNSLFVVFPR